LFVGDQFSGKDLFLVHVAVVLTCKDTEGETENRPGGGVGVQ